MCFAGLLKEISSSLWLTSANASSALQDIATKAQTWTDAGQVTSDDWCALERLQINWTATAGLRVLSQQQHTGYDTITVRFWEAHTPQELYIESKFQIESTPWPDTA